MTQEAIQHTGRENIEKHLDMLYRIAQLALNAARHAELEKSVEYNADSQAATQRMLSLHENPKLTDEEKQEIEDKAAFYVQLHNEAVTKANS